MSTREEKNAAILQVMHREPKEKFTAADLQILRESSELLEGHDQKTDYFQFPMEIELIDAIRSLDEASGKLIEKTNSLTKAILWLTVATVGLAVIQILITVFGHNK